MNEILTEAVEIADEIYTVNESSADIIQESGTSVETENFDDTEQDSGITTEELNQTIATLKAELEAYKAAAAQQEAIAKQLNEFAELFPEISVRSIPDEVWEDVKKGNSLAAAYSIYERRITEAARRIELINQKNAQNAAGVAGKNMPQEFFSADDVRKMSPSEVRANYAKIRRSMEKWN